MQNIKHLRSWLNSQIRWQLQFLKNHHRRPRECVCWSTFARCREENSLWPKGHLCSFWMTWRNFTDRVVEFFFVIVPRSPRSNERKTRVRGQVSKNGAVRYCTCHVREPSLIISRATTARSSRALNVRTNQMIRELCT